MLWETLVYILLPLLIGVSIPLQKVGHSVGQFILHIWQNMGINVQGDGDAGMPRRSPRYTPVNAVNIKR